MKLLKTSIIILAIALIGYNSVYFSKLDQIKSERAGAAFNASSYATEFWKEKLLPNLNKAIDIASLTDLLLTNKEKAFTDYSHALGIGNLRYFLVKGKGKIEAINENDVTVNVEGLKSPQTVSIATEYVFGNAVRDATGLININEFKNTMDFNNVSAELNRMIREQVLPGFKKSMKLGSNIEFSGAVELNREHLDLTTIEIIPLQVTVVE